MLQQIISKLWRKKRPVPPDIIVSCDLKHEGKMLYIKPVFPGEGNVTVVLDGRTRAVKDVYMAKP